MKNKKVQIIILILLALCFLTVSTAFAQGAISFDLSWFTIAGGGQTSSSDDFVMVGTIGQPAVGPTINGGNFSLTSGFWLSENPIVGPEIPRPTIYLPVVMRSP